MPLPSKKNEQELAVKHALELEALIEDGIVESDKAYATAENIARENGGKRESALAALGMALGLLLQRNRTKANELATLHTTQELKAIIGSKIDRITLPFGPTPKPAEMDKYINNAVDLARKSPTIEETSHRGRLIVVSETVGQYGKGKEAAIGEVAKIPPGKQQDLGIQVPKSQAEIDSATPTQNEGDDIVICEVWNAILDRHTCAQCRAYDTREVPPGAGFPWGYPPVHANCRCFTTLFTAGYAPAKRAFRPMTLPSKKTEPVCTRVEFAIDERAEFDIESRTIRNAIASDESLDSHGTIIKADGWNLERYAKNPVLIWAHKAGGFKSPEPEDVLGRTTTRVVDRKLVSDLQFSAVNPKAQRVFEMMKEGTIKGLSVGFRPQSYHFEKAADGDEIIIIDKQELIEVSVVPVPSNGNTLAKELRELLCDSCECEREENETAAMPQPEIAIMDKTAALVLPATIAALLHVDNVDDAVREISKKDLELDAALRRVKEAEERAAAAEKKLQERDEKETIATVDSLIAAGRISNDKRESALALARTSPQAFRDLYPVVTEPPKAHLLKRIVEPEDKTAPEKQSECVVDPITKRAQELQSQGISYQEAFNRAMSEYRSSVRS